MNRRFSRTDTSPQGLGMTARTLRRLPRSAWTDCSWCFGVGAFFDQTHDFCRYCEGTGLAVIPWTELFRGAQR